MNEADVYVTAGVVGIAAGILARVLLGVRLNRAPDAVAKTNVRGARVPAVMGEAVAAAALVLMAATTLAGAAGWDVPWPRKTMAAAAVAIVVMALAGSWDDRRGDERPRGFSGHLRAAGGGLVTGGTVKLVAGGVAGLTSGIVVASDEGVAAVVETGLLVALGANFVNLTDRAPGRAGKVFLLLAIPLALFGAPGWVVAAAPLMGALVGCLRMDLKERAMLGDAGANPLGAGAGLGLAVSLTEPGRLVAIAVLLGLNLASEKWSYSRAIQRVAVLRALDGFGRLKAPAAREVGRTK